MSRLEEFKETAKLANDNFESMSTEGALKNNNLIMLTEIAESLAVIADTLREININQQIKNI